MAEQNQKLKSLADELKDRLSVKEKDSGKSIDIKEHTISPEEEKEIKEKSEKISKKEIDEEKKAKKEIDEEKKGIDEEKKGITTKEETLIPLEDYIKCAVHLGTKVITPHMRKYVYKRRADGLAVINTILIDKKIGEAIEFITEYKPENIYLSCKREAGWIAAKKFEEMTGIKVYTKKYSPGITTNLELEDFFESELTIICDPWIDKNALNDTLRLKKPVLALCDTNNYAAKITKIIPCNNKSGKSIGCILYILAREYCKKKRIPFKATLEDFAGKLE